MTVADALALLDLSMPFTESELTNAYRQAMAMWSPDRFPEAELRVKAAEKVRRANLAYAVLLGVPNSGGGAAMPLMKKERPTAPPVPASLRAVQPATSMEKKVPASEPQREAGAHTDVMPPKEEGPPTSPRPRPKALALHLVAPTRPASPPEKKESKVDHAPEPAVSPGPISPAGSPTPPLETEKPSSAVSSESAVEASPAVAPAEAPKEVAEPGSVKDLTLLAPPLPSALRRPTIPGQPSRTESVEEESPLPLNAWAWVALLFAVLPIVPGLDLWAWASSVVAAVGCAAVAESRAKRLASSGRWVAVCSFVLALATGGWQTFSALKTYREKKVKSDYELALRLLDDKSDPASQGRGFALMRDLAEKDHSGAQQKLWPLYEQGIGTEANLEKAIQWLLIVADKGDPAAQAALGEHYDKGTGVKQDSKEAERWYQKALSQGYLPAQTALGRRYATGTGVLKDMKQAVNLWQDAAEKGEPTAQWYLGYVYETGEGAAQDTKKAMGWYLKAAENGVANAQVRLAQCYQEGAGVPRDLSQAAHWLQAAADQGHPQALCDLANCYERGDGVDQDLKMAAKLFFQAAEAGNGKAMISAALFHKLGDGGIEKDPQKSYQWYIRATEAGESQAFIHVALCHLLGEGVPQNEAKAREWYLRCPKEPQDPEELYNLGVRYEKGEGVEADPFQAYACYTCAAVQGHAPSQGALGNFLYYGKGGTAKDAGAAARLFLLAARKGQTLYQSLLGTCYEKGDGVEKDMKEALKWHREAATHGNIISKLALISIYHEEGALADEVESLAWYSLAKTQIEQEEPENLGGLSDEYAQLIARSSADIRERVDKRIAEIRSKYPQCLVGGASARRVAAKEMGERVAATNGVLVDVLSASGGSAMRPVTLDNWLDDDVQVKVLRDRSLVASFYLKARTELTFKTMPAGTYMILYCSGKEWDGALQEFHRGLSAMRYREPVTVAREEEQPGPVRIKLVKPGESKVRPIPLAEFARY